MPSVGAGAAKRGRILQIAFYESLLHTRASLLEGRGFEVTSALGNDRAMALDKDVFLGLDLIVIGFSARYETRSRMLRWCKQNYPQIPVCMLQANGLERFSEADCVTLSEEPEVWLGLVAGWVTARGGPE